MIQPPTLADDKLANAKLDNIEILIF